MWTRTVRSHTLGPLPKRSHYTKHQWQRLLWERQQKRIIWITTTWLDWSWWVFSSSSALPLSLSYSANNATNPPRMSMITLLELLWSKFSSFTIHAFVCCNIFLLWVDFWSNRKVLSSRNFIHLSGKRTVVTCTTKKTNTITKCKSFSLMQDFYRTG